MAEIYTLGAGTPTPTPTRFGSSHVLKLGGQLLMFDCGPATTHKLVKAGLFPTQVDYLFFTHHHFDHDIDYPCFLLCRWDQSIGEENQLQVFGPDLTERITEGILGENGFCSPTTGRRRVNHTPEPAGFRQPGRHAAPAGAVGVGSGRGAGQGVQRAGLGGNRRAGRARSALAGLPGLPGGLSAEGSVIFTGDTQPCDSVTELARGADLMLCMCWDDQACDGRQRGV